jgi:tetratricopeptide (TPR) repeat protein
VLAVRVAYAQEAGDTKTEAARLFEEGRADSQHGDFAAACDRFTRSYSLDQASGTKLNLGNCHEQLGHLQKALKWFQEAEEAFTVAHDQTRADFAHERAVALQARLALLDAPPPKQPAPATTSSRGAWRVAFWTLTVTAAAGVGVWVYGHNQIQDATDKLCAGGAYGSSRPDCPIPPNPLTPAQVQVLNDQGHQGRDITVVGGGVAFLATAIAALSLYEGYIRSEHDVVVTPAVGGGTAGAVITARW